MKGRPDIKPPKKPFGMDKATEKRLEREWREKQRRVAKKSFVPVEERVIVAEAIPLGARLKGYESFTIQDLKMRFKRCAIAASGCCRRIGRTVIA